MKPSFFDSEEINAFHDSIREHLIASDDKQFLQELKEDGVDTKARSQEIRSILLAGIKDYHVLKRKELSHKKERLVQPSTLSELAGRPIAELRKALENLSKKLNPEQLTLCFRGRPQGDLNDDEVKAALSKLQMLGVLDEPNP